MYACVVCLCVYTNMNIDSLRRTNSTTTFPLPPHRSLLFLRGLQALLLSTVKALLLSTVKALPLSILKASLLQRRLIVAFCYSRPEGSATESTKGSAT